MNVLTHQWEDVFCANRFGFGKHVPLSAPDRPYKVQQ